MGAWWVPGGCLVGIWAVIMVVAYYFLLVFAVYFLKDLLLE